MPNIQRTSASRRPLLGAMVTFLLVVACGGPAAVATVAPTAEPPTSGPDLEATALAAEVAEAIEQTEAAQRDIETAEAEEAEAAAATTTELAATEEVLAAKTATAEQKATEAEERKAARTANAAVTQQQATQVAQSLAARVQQIEADGYLTRSAGEYARLDDFSDAWAQINWYQWLWTGYEPVDFVLRADFSWESASDRANWFNSGCGFVFREASRENLDHYLVYLGLDSVVYFVKVRAGESTLLGSANTDKLDIPAGAAQFMLAADGDKFTVYVNDERVITTHDGSLKEGLLNYTLLSGTNRDYGTRCNIENVELWTLDPP